MIKDSDFLCVQFLHGEMNVHFVFFFQRFPIHDHFATIIFHDHFHFSFQVKKARSFFQFRVN